MIVLYQGHRGCGKTTTLIKDGYALKRCGWTVVTNMTSVSYADRVLDESEILNLLNTDLNDFVIMLDEIQTFIDSRRGMRGKNVTFTYFIQQIRKRNVIILAATQYTRRVDIAFREHVDVLCKPKFYPEYPVIVAQYVDLTKLSESGIDSETVVFRDVVYDPRQVYDLFDTTEIILPGEAVSSQEKVIKKK